MPFLVIPLRAKSKTLLGHSEIYQRGTICDTIKTKIASLPYPSANEPDEVRSNVAGGFVVDCSCRKELYLHPFTRR